LPPRPPRFSEITAGDRRIHLDWPLDHAPEIAEYRIYRADTNDALDDLRWFDDGDDPRIVARCPDPLIRVSMRSVVLPSPSSPAEALTELVAVFRLDEYDRAQPGDAQTRAFDLRDADTAFADGTIARLRRVADGVPVVVVGRNANGALVTIARTADRPPYDDPVVPYREQFYRLATVDTRGHVSVGSPIVSGQAFDATPPSPPSWDFARWATSTGGLADHVELRWLVADPGHRCILERKTARDTRWTPLGPWTANTGRVVVDGNERWVFEMQDGRAAPNLAYDYRVRVVNARSITNTEFVSIAVPPAG